MKLNIRIILINLTIVVMILGGSALAFYSILFNLINSQQKRYLQNSANNLLISLDDLFLQAEESFLRHLNSNGTKKAAVAMIPHGLDFIGTLKNDSLFERETFIASVNVDTSFSNYSVAAFSQKNPFAIIFEYKQADGKSYYYGIVLTRELLNYLSIRVGSEISVYLPDNEVVFSNESVNREYLYIVNTAYNFLSRKNNFDIYSYQSGTDYFIATIYRMGHSVINAGNFTIIIFSALKEAESLNRSVQSALVTLGIAGVFLSLILTFIFTGKIRRQIDELNTATDIVKTGNFKSRLDIESKDEIGELAEAFNTMLSELDKQEEMKKDYTEFISVINKNPDQSEIASTALEKITRLPGILYAKIFFISGTGIEIFLSKGEAGLSSEEEVKEVINTLLEKPEARSDNSFAITSKTQPAGKNYWRFLLPAVYGESILAVIEFGSSVEIMSDIKEHIQKMIAQLAIGLNNARTLKLLGEIVEELRQLNEESRLQNKKILEQNERLRELHSELTAKADELSIQMKRAEEMTELKSRFLATISHELRTPLSTMIGLTELLIRTGAHDDKTVERLNVILNSGRRLLALINGILDLSKIEAGKMDVNIELFSLNELISELRDTFSVPAASKNLDFAITNEFSGPALLKTDRYKLLQILINLLGNAIKFTEKGSVELIIKPTGEKDAEFSVKDTGIGIPPEAKEIIFEEFRQVDSSSTRKHGGSGLGLTISEKFTELLGGRLCLTSEVNAGSVFTLTLPGVVYLEEDLPATAGIDYPAGEGKTLSHKPLRFTGFDAKNTDILIVDDDPDTLFTLNEIIRSEGFRTLLAKNGIECLEILEKKIPGLVLLDIMMPRMDGLQAIKVIRADARLRNLPVIAVTAKAMLDEKEIIKSAGFTDYISKPIDTDLLLETIDTIFSRRE